MLTQIEIDGFKTFKDFKVELAPFQVIIGPNGSGKSNLFDALHLLSRLAEHDLLTAFQNLRGNADEQFTKYPDGRTNDRIRFAVEMLVDRKVQDDLGVEEELQYTRLRYELEIEQRTDEYGLDQLYVTQEALRTIPRASDSWSKKYKLSSQNGWLPMAPDTGEHTFFSFIEKDEILSISNLSHSSSETQLPGRLSRTLRTITRTVLSSSTVASVPYVIAVRQELYSLRFLLLNPKALRQSSSVKAPRFLSPEGGDLPATLARMQAEDEFALTDVSRDMTNLVPDIFKIKVEKNTASNEYDIWAETSDQRTFSTQVLSDGTLRLLAVATLRNDPRFQGVLCLEEPENGVDPRHLDRMTTLLRDMATDFNDPHQAKDPLRQVLITTHSPLFISQPGVIDSLLLAVISTQMQGQNTPSLRVTRMVPVATSHTPPTGEIGADKDKALEAYTIDMVKRYLASEAMDEAREQLDKARKNLRKE